jgi:hypothetical protein
MTMRRVVLLTVVLAALAAAVGAGVASSRADDPRAAVPTPNRQSAAASQTPAPELPAHAALIASTRQSVGTFKTKKGDQVELIAGDLAPDFDLLTTVLEDAKVTTQQACVLDRGNGYAGLSCAAKPLFKRSLVLYSTTAAGGPATTEYTEYYISGLVHPKVARIEAVTSAGGTVAADLSGKGAFFLELGREQLAQGVIVTNLRLYGANGALLEDRSLK